MSKEEIASSTGLKHYTDTPVFFPNLWDKLWKLQPPTEEEFTERPLYYYSEKYEEWLKNPPSLILTTCQQLKGKTLLPLEIRSGQDLAIGTVISEYTGIFSLLPPVNNLRAFFTNGIDGTFRTGLYDAAVAGNAARWTNSGFPNCGLMDMGNYAGAPRHLLFLLENVPKNTPLIWDYGVNQAVLTFGAQVLLQREAVRVFFKQGISALCASANLLKKQIVEFKGRIPQINTEKYLAFQLMTSRIQHPLQCPGTLLDLHFSNIIRAEAWGAILTSCEDEAFSLWMESNPFFSHVIYSFVLRILELEKVLKTNPKIKEQVYLWVLESIGNLSIMQILQGFEEIKKDVSRLEAESDFFTQLNLKLKSYDWLKDENAPLSLSRRKIDKLYALRSIMTDGEILTWTANSISRMKPDSNDDNYEMLLWILGQID